MELFHHDQAAEHQRLSHLHVESGDDWVGLTFETHDQLPHEIAVFRSDSGCADESLDPIIDPRQRLVYQGTDLHSRIKDDGLTDGVRYYYSVFVRGSDGHWHQQLKMDVTLHKGHHRFSHEEDFETQATELYRCDLCRGTGLASGLNPLGCPACHGKGWVRIKVPEMPLQTH